MRRASAAIASGGSCRMPAATSRSALCAGCVPARPKGRAPVGLRLAFDFRSRSSKRKFEPRHRFDPGKCLVYRPEIGWVPNGPSEQPQRKPGVRERFRASGASPRCTAVREKRRDSWASAGRSAGGETCSPRASWRRERNCRQTLSAAFQWLTNYINCGGCCLENPGKCCPSPPSDPAGKAADTAAHRPRAAERQAQAGQGHLCVG